MKNTKKSLLTSALCLLLCMSMLVGTTFAWFTDEVKSGNNIIAAGNLDVELYWSTDAKNWEPVNSGTNVFTEDLWEPGHTEVVYLKVANEGNLALKYNLIVNIASEKGSTNVYGEEFELSDHIEYGIVPVTKAFADRNAAIGSVMEVANGLKTPYNPDTKTLYPTNNMPTDITGAVSEEVVAVVVYMPTSVGNEANYDKAFEAPEIELGISLFATQLTYEEDSFGDDYDEDSAYDVALGEKVEFLNAIINAGIENNGELTMTGGVWSNEGAALDNFGNATLSDLTVNAGTPTDYALRALAGSVTVLDDVDLNAAGGGIGADGGAKVTINGGSVDVSSESTSGRYNIYAVGEGTVVTVNGGEYSFSKTLNQKRAYVYVGAGAKVVINGGTFGAASTRKGYTTGILGDGEVIITGGTFGFDPTNWVAAGYSVVNNNGTYYVVKDDIGAVASDADDLVAALEEGKGVALLNDVKIDPAGMSNAYGTTGINVKNGQTIDGNGNTLDIKGAGGTWDSGINTTGGLIKDITITGSFRGIFINHNSTHSEPVVLENVTIEGTTYTISCDQGMNQTLTATKSTFKGWTSYAATLGEAKFVDCYFGYGNGYSYMRPYAPTTFVDCNFEAGFEMDARAAVVFENCYLDGVLITADNVATLVTGNTANATVK